MTTGLAAEWQERRIHGFEFAAPCALSRKGSIRVDIQPLNDAALECETFCRSTGHAVLLLRNGSTFVESPSPIFGSPILLSRWQWFELPSNTRMISSIRRGPPCLCAILANIHRRNLFTSALGVRPVRGAVPLTQPPLPEASAIAKRGPPAALDAEMQETVRPLFDTAAPRNTRLFERRLDARHRQERFILNGHGHTGSTRDAKVIYCTHTRPLQ
jgi:hypothetical protein